MQSDGSNQEIIWRTTDDGWCAEHMSWSPDSTAIVGSLVPADGFDLPVERQIWFISEEDRYLIQSTIFEDQGCLILDVVFSPDGEQVAYFDNCQPMIVSALGDGQPQPIGGFPYHWQGMAYPRWEGEMPELVEFEDGASDLSEDYREVRPCEWEGHGPGLCIYGPDSPQPVRKLLQDEGLESIALPSWNPNGEEIVFSAIPQGGTPEGDYTLYRVRADGTELTKLPQLHNDLYPDWSPDGEWFAFHSGCDLAIMRPDGSDQETLWEHDEDWCVEAISWSPNSDAVVVSLVPTGGFLYPLERQIWFVSDDMHLIQSTVFEDEECTFIDVVFSPDSEQVAYFDGCQPMIIDVYGEGQPRPIGDFPHHWQGMAYPRWEGEMPELVELDDELLVEIGGTIVETCDELVPPQICVREVQTDQVYQITRDLDFESIYMMSWSPDGTQIVFDGGWGDKRDLYIVNSDGSELRQLTDTEDHEVIATWSPIGEWIAFHRNCGIWLIRPDGSEEIMLREGGEDFCVGAIGWSPDGRNLTYLNYDGSDRIPGEIWVMNLDEETEQPIFGFEPDIDPWTVTWEPSGRKVLFLFGMYDDQTHMLLLDPHGEQDPQELGDNEFGDMEVWTWLPDFWPQWGGAR
jgi:Tol biopolymer transport system component